MRSQHEVEQLLRQQEEWLRRNPHQSVAAAAATMARINAFRWVLGLAPHPTSVPSGRTQLGVPAQRNTQKMAVRP